MLANVQYRTMSLQERGLLYSLRLECWVNQSMPADPATLARVLGLGTDMVKEALPLVMPFFRLEGGQIVCPELEDYRSHLNETRAKQSEGGKLGAAITNGTRNKPKTRKNKGSESTPTGTPQDDSRVNFESLVQPSTAQPSKTQSFSNVGIHDPWVDEYERATDGY
jgi:uncharacterized protein YdaU (DUF1376 family)